MRMEETATDFSLEFQRVQPIGADVDA